MNTLSRLWAERPLTRRLLISIVLFSTLATFAGVTLQLYLDYHRDLAEVDNQLNNIQLSHTESLAGSLWSLNTDQIETELQNIAKIRDVINLKIFESNGTIHHAGRPPDVGEKTKSVRSPLIYKTNDGAHHIGDIEILMSLSGADQRLFDRLLTIILTQGFQIFLVSVFILFIFHSLITRHLKVISDYAKNTNINKLDHALDLNRPANITQNGDELQTLVNAINQMNIRLASDIYERELSEMELRRLRNYLSNIINSMPSVLIGVDDKGRVTQWNDEAQHVTGISADEAEGKMLTQVFPRLSSEMDRVQYAISSHKQQFDSNRPLELNGETHYEDVTIYPLSTNGTEGAVIRLDDVTKQVRLEEAVIQSEKMLSVGGLAAGMAHEINNPLAGMMQVASVMKNRLSNPDMPANLRAAKLAEVDMENILTYMEARGILNMLDDINTSGQRIAEIVNNMLSFAHKRESSFSTNNLAKLIDKALELAATDYDLKKQYDFKKIEIIRKYDSNLPAVPCEAAKIQQVILNILRNGAQVMQDANIEAPTFTLHTYLDSTRNMATIEIEDNGPGMNENTRKRVFEPFFTTKPEGEGTGLGMSVSFFIITENHGGEMHVKSEPGKGARFIIRLPLTPS